MLLFQGAPTLDPELWTYSKQFLPKLHERHSFGEAETIFLDWQVDFPSWHHLDWLVIREWEKAAPWRSRKSMTSAVATLGGVFSKNMISVSLSTKNSVLA